MKLILHSLVGIAIFSAATLAKSSNHNACELGAKRCVSDPQPKLQGCRNVKPREWQDLNYCKVCTGGEDYPECEEY
jgi:hypothetical protein